MSWWLTDVAVGCSMNVAIAASGTRLAGVLLSTLPLDALRSAGFGETGNTTCVVLAASCADVELVVATRSVATTRPPLFTSDVPGTYTSASAFGLCVYSGAHSMTT